MDDGIRRKHKGEGADMTSTRLDKQVEPVKPMVAKVVEAIRPRLGDSDFENLQGAPTLGSGISALHDRPGF